MARAEDVPPLPPAWSGRAPSPTYSWRPGDPHPGDIPAAEPMTTAGRVVNATPPGLLTCPAAGTEAAPARGEPQVLQSLRRRGCDPTSGTPQPARPAARPDPAARAEPPTHQETRP